VKSSIKFAAFAAVSVLAGCRGWETEERPIHLIKNMDTQEKGKAYRRDSTGLFAERSLEARWQRQVLGYGDAGN
jgi:hypothetical protein